ncbi:MULTISPECIES: TonB-dependent receptor [Gammaproteobacteria]|uniref:TonB-dependent receptor n=1 Tax=Gammaproteobacteria TaxID=1236 RepID=UPI000DCFE6D8|nr:MULTISPECIES: TonB-dependent receptor [Gammaproteobacteria]RTE86854.1 TonB-dependent receptor [Aliidiomarina sp. B3213]TCZ93357.1 TonB-dependent receptor [Lysobacter sp. N42]
MKFKKSFIAKQVITALAFSSVAVSAMAQNTQENDVADEHDHDYERIVVTASPLQKSAVDSAQPIYVMSQDELRQSQAATLGETLRSIVGVQASYFSPVSSSPIIRGLGGPRVRILQNGLDVADISRGGPDHAVSTETSTAQQVEIFRGPSTLLFGSGASGGVVNVVDNRVPRFLEQGVSGEYGVQYNDVSDEKLVSGEFNARSGDFAFHLDAFKRDADNYSVPEFTNDEGEVTDHIENSYTEDEGYTIGSSYLFNGGFIGFSVGRLDRTYGIPGHSHGHEDEHAHEEEGAHDEHEEHEEEGVYALFKQDRYQLLSSFVEPMSGIQRLDINFGYSELSHNEIEEELVASGFAVEQSELRVSATHTAVMGWTGAFGAQFEQREYSSNGEEAYTPTSDTDLAGLFWLVEKQFGALTVEAGARYEEVSLETEEFNTLEYTPMSFSLGARYSVNENLSLAFNSSYSERAPQANELFSDGAHLATGTYELGGVYELHEAHHEEEGAHEEHEGEEVYHIERRSNALATENSQNIDLGLHYQGDRFHVEANVFWNEIENFIYQQNSGVSSAQFDEHAHEEHEGEAHEEEHAHGELPVYVYQQQDARLYGYEISGHYQLSTNWHVDAFTDYTRAKFVNGGNIPRIPAQRVGATLKYLQPNWDTSLSVTRYNEQDKVGINEEATEGFSLVNVRMNYYPGRFANQDFSVYLKVENLTDELGFVHSSFIKEDAPLPGRNVGIGIRAHF